MIPRIAKEKIALEELKRRILAEGRNLGGGILKIDSILNHQMDPVLMAEMGREFARRFEHSGATRILTAEVSGIGPALATGIAMKLPVVYARKRKPITMKEPVYVETAPSPTKGGDVLLMVSPEFLHADDRVLIIDDFLASGKTLEALVHIVKQAGAEVVGIGTVVEKAFESGREILSDHCPHIESLVIVKAMVNGEIILED